MFFLNSKISRERQKKLKLFQKKAGVRFKNIHLLEQALTHRSAVKVHSKSNERLEFLGDAVLGVIVSDYLFRNFPKADEGELTRIKSAAVSENSLFTLADHLHIADYLVLGKGEMMSGGKEKKAILADSLEALIGAVYVDSGFKIARGFVLNLVEEQIKIIARGEDFEDFKSILQGFAQRKFKTRPIYTVEKTEGPDHDLRFWVSLKLDKYSFGPCVGKTKKDAEQEVATIACKKLIK